LLPARFGGGTTLESEEWNRGESAQNENPNRPFHTRKETQISPRHKRATFLFAGQGATSDSALPAHVGPGEPSRDAALADYRREVDLIHAQQSKREKWKSP
jgi:hypothetical protein